LVELVVVLVLAGILAATALPRLSQGVVEVSAQAEQVAADIRYAQSLSMTRGARYCISFTGTGYQLRTTNCTVAVNHPATGSPAAIVLSGTTVTFANLNANAIEFDTKGRPQSFTVPTNNGTVTLTSNGQTRSIVVSPETGKATVP
jgi:type II secretory pathway pseudopilin PulG